MTTARRPPHSRPVLEDPAVDAMVTALPKVSLHCPLIGSVPPRTVVDLAARHGVPLDRGADDLCDHDSYEDLGEFLRVLDVTGSVIRDVEDFHRVTYESLTAGGAAHGVPYREIHLSPPGHPGVPYPRILEGVVAGMRDARVDTGIDARLVIGINRERSGADAVELVEQVIEHRIDEVVGIGLDHAEVGPPERFVEVRADDARRARLQPVDHSYHVVDDPEITARCVAEWIPSTCTPVSSDIGRYSGSGDGTHHRIRQRVDAGLCVTIDSDDPPMFGTDPTHDLRVLAHVLGYRREQLAASTSNAIHACWLDETDSAALRARAESMVAATPDAPHPTTAPDQSGRPEGTRR